MKTFVASFLLFLVAAGGCGKSTESVAVEEPAATAEIKSSLEHLAESGVVDSGVMMLEENIQKLKETDPGTANALEADLAELKAARSPSAVKSKASSMLEKL